MSSASGDGRRILVLGPSTGWHANQLMESAERQNHTLDFVSYESLSAGVADASRGKGSIFGTAERGRVHPRLDHPRLDHPRLDHHGLCSIEEFDAILVRTMPNSSLERITFRLACLHAIDDGISGLNIPVVNPPRGLEIAIDKFATLSRLHAAGYATPSTRFVQSRAEAMEAFHELGGDCVVKPLLGGEGRGVMRLSDPQLAWYCFSTLDQLDSVLQIQQFVPPGGRDRRYLVIGEQVFGIRRENSVSFRSNVSAGGRSECFEVSPDMAKTARRIVQMLGLSIASVDQIDNENGPPLFLEVNAIPGWKGAQCVLQTSIADEIIRTVISQIDRRIATNDSTPKPSVNH